MVRKSFMVTYSSNSSRLKSSAVEDWMVLERAIEMRSGWVDLRRWPFWVSLFNYSGKSYVSVSLRVLGEISPSPELSETSLAKFLPMGCSSFIWLRSVLQCWPGFLAGLLVILAVWQGEYFLLYIWPGACLLDSPWCFNICECKSNYKLWSSRLISSDSCFNDWSILRCYASENRSSLLSSSSNSSY